MTSTCTCTSLQLVEYYLEAFNVEGFHHALAFLGVSLKSAPGYSGLFNPLPTNDSYGCAHFFHKPVRIHRGVLILGDNRPHLHRQSYGW